MAAFIGEGQVVAGQRRATASAPPLGEFPVDRASRAPDGEVDVVLRPEPVLVYPPAESTG